MSSLVTEISRKPETAASEPFDLVIVGGGIYGAMLSLEAGRRNLRALLLEGQDFGGGTSYNSLRIIHGGLRYLQNLNLPRFRESVQERRWFLQQYPALVRPLPCLMPLHNNGLKRRSVLRTALFVNDLLSVRRNVGIDPEHAIPSGTVIDADTVERVSPGIRHNGVLGAAVWYDAHMVDSQRVLIETLCRACALGGSALNYVRVDGLLINKRQVTGVRATDHESHREFEFRAPVVINTSGPGCRALAARWDRDTPELFRPSLAWNVLFDVPAPSTHALALTPNYEGARTYFLHPWKGRLLAGTGHAPWSGDPVHPRVSDELMDDFIADINSILPGADLNSDQIVRIYRGFLPVTREGTVDLSDRETIVDHGKRRGPDGLFSVSGVKFTTSRRVASKTLATAFPGVRCQVPDQGISVRTRAGVAAGMPWAWRPDGNDAAWRHELRQIINEEAVVHIDDLVMRRTGIGDDPERARAMAADVAELFDWDNDRRDQEIARITKQPAIDRF